jgi:hypothetical protein
LYSLPLTSIIIIISTSIFIMAPDLNLSPKLDSIAAADVEITSLESQIARLQTQLVAMKKTRNSFTPLCQLPYEILGRILLQVQAPALRKPISSHFDGLLHDFEHDQDWEKGIMLTCSRVREVCIGTSLLWAHIDLSWPIHKIKEHLMRAGTVNLTLQWRPADRTTLQDDVHARKEIQLIKPIILACLHRACATYISLKYNIDKEAQTIMQILAGCTRAPKLTILHVDLDRKYGQAVLQSPKLSSTLVQLSLWNFALDIPVTAHFPRLLRMHLQNVFMDQYPKRLIQLLQRAPNLTDLVLNEMHVHSVYGDVFPLPEDTLTLRSLRSLVLIGNPLLVFGALTALAPLDHPLLQELVVEAQFEHPTRPSESAIPFLLFQKTMAHWNAISRSLLSVKIVWKPCEDEQSLFLDICTPPLHVSPTLTLRTLYCDDEASLDLYRHHGIELRTIEVAWLRPDTTTAPWTTLLDERLRSCASDLKKFQLTIIFCGCMEGVPGLQSWIQSQQSEGLSIQKVVFVDSSRSSSLATWSDYVALKESGLVQEVEFI